MTLFCQRYHTERTERPWLVFLHGLLGSGDDWLPLIPYLREWRCLLVDLPGHGASQYLTAAGFADVSQRLSTTLRQQEINDYWLVGYSLGGRIGLYHACQGDARGMRGLLVEGSHPGLADLRQRQRRQHHDQRWIARFLQQPWLQVLDHWYQQPVFSELTAAQRQNLIALRANNNPVTVAAMFSATSLSIQPDLCSQLRHLSLPYTWLCGSHDLKFQAIAHQASFPLRTIADAGHNAHRANPADFAHQMMAFIHHSHYFPVLKEVEHDLSR